MLFEHLVPRICDDESVEGTLIFLSFFQFAFNCYLNCNRKLILDTFIKIFTKNTHWIIIKVCDQSTCFAFRFKTQKLSKTNQFCLENQIKIIINRCVNLWPAVTLSSVNDVEQQTLQAHYRPFNHKKEILRLGTSSIGNTIKAEKKTTKHKLRRNQHCTITKITTTKNNTSMVSSSLSF